MPSLWKIWPWFALVLISNASAADHALAPPDALREMKVADGFEVRLFASEPHIRQPVAMYFDERGRLWVIQYLQYPTPAGLTPSQVDQYLRTKYDAIPEPPPRGPKGADRITLCEDLDGDGRADQFRDFVTGLNLATGLAVGHGGVFVVQPPYLLFYADKNRDDIPDTDPEVLLSGFGMEDSHAFANSLQWGPDGWLYGAQGSTVTANIRGIEFQQGIWRYHPLTREFELFSEGGGNTWGVDFDAAGQVIAGTNFGDTIGLHQVQGGYYVKGFAKHGPLHNPHAYGYFEHLPFQGFQGGHVTCGGILYEGDSFSAEFKGTYIAGNLLANAVYWHRLERAGSTFKGRFGGVLLSTADRWFRPVDCALAPDGSVFIADWYDKRATHVDPLDDWDRSNGRIYRIQAKGKSQPAPFDLAQFSNAKLLELLAHPNGWWRREARRFLAERRDRSLLPQIEKLVIEATQPQTQLEALWAWFVTAGHERFRATATSLLSHPNEHVRAWTIRLLADSPPHTPLSEPALVQRLTELARKDPSPMVRQQLACTAKRLTTSESLPVLRELLRHDEDASDPFIPLLIWWAIENHVGEQANAVVQLFDSPDLWNHAIAREIVTTRLARRLASDDSTAGFAFCLRLLEMAPGALAREPVLEGLDQALVGKRFSEKQLPIRNWLENHWPAADPPSAWLRLGLRLEIPQAIQTALRHVENPSAAEKQRVELIEILSQLQLGQSLPVLRQLLEDPSSPVRNAALAALQNFANRDLAGELLRRYNQWNPDLRKKVLAMLASRPAWALELIDAVERGSIPSGEIGFDLLRQMSRHNDATLSQGIEKRWGRIQADSAGARRNAINQFKLLLVPSGNPSRLGKGDLESGQVQFQKLCAVCHKLFGTGNEIGPDLTGADRQNVDFLLLHIVDPSAYVRPEYLAHEVLTQDDQSFSGILVENSPAAVTLLDGNNQRHLIARDRIKRLQPSAVSLMPEGLLEQLKPNEVIDLFTFLQSQAPPAHRAK
ncbi:MAG: PVC-type heme-binding CxxCH protein [Verrucomicrobiota bacterium]